jgi:iron complex transport system ATP-binding protein
VPQSLYVPFAFRVEEIVVQGRVPFLGRFGNMSRHDLEVVEHAMEAVDVLPLRRRVYEELSGGEMQRVKIAIALAQEPKLMLLDEPTQHLDIGRQIEIVQLLRRLNASGITVLAAIHDLSLARQSFGSAVLLTPEPACYAGATQEILRPELLERAFTVSGASFGDNDVIGDDVRSAQCRTTPRHRRRSSGNRSEA